MEFEGFAAATTQGRSSNSPFGSSSWRLPTALLVGALSNGHAEVLITGDSDLLALNPFRGVPIITPAGLRAGCLTLKHPALGMHFNVDAQPAEIPVRLRRFAEHIGAAAWQSAKAIFSGRYDNHWGSLGKLLASLNAGCEDRARGADERAGALGLLEKIAVRSEPDEA